MRTNIIIPIAAKDKTVAPIPVIPNISSIVSVVSLNGLPISLIPYPVAANPAPAMPVPTPTFTPVETILPDAASLIRQAGPSGQ